MMKPEIPPVRGTLHKAWSEGCRMWAPVVQAIEKSSQAAHQVEPVTEVPRLAGSGTGEESAAAAAGIKP